MSGIVEPLGPPHVEALRSLLSRDATHNLYLLGLLEEFGIVSATEKAPFTFYGRFFDDALTAAMFVGGGGGLVIPSSSPASAILELTKSIANRLTTQSIIGDKSLVEAMTPHLIRGAPSMARDQRLFSVSADDLGPFTNPLLRPATEADLPQLVPLAAQAIIETVSRDPLKEDPEGFPLRIRQRVRTQRTYVLEEKGKLVFKLDIGSRSQSGAELEGLYTLPGERQKGHATLCLGQISRFLLSSLPRLTLRVDDKSPALANIARRVGYVGGRPQRTVLA